MYQVGHDSEGDRIGHMGDIQPPQLTIEDVKMGGLSAYEPGEHSALFERSEITDSKSLGSPDTSPALQLQNGHSTRRRV